MELVYLWVEDYNNVHRQGFNFSPRFECKFYDEYEKYIDENGEEKERLKDNCELVICDKEKGECLDKDTKKCKPCKDNGYIKDFFGDNINITAIVGKNGSGKSSILEILIRLYNIGYIKNNDYSFFIYKKNNQFYIINNFYRHCIIPCNILNKYNLINIKDNIKNSIYELQLYTNCISKFDLNLVSKQIIDINSKNLPQPLYNNYACDIKNCIIKEYDENTDFKTKYFNIKSKMTLSKKYLFDQYYYYFNINDINHTLFSALDIISDFDDTALTIKYPHHKKDFFYRLIALLIYIKTRNYLDIEYNYSTKIIDDFYHEILIYFRKQINLIELKNICEICYNKSEGNISFDFDSQDISEFSQMFNTNDNIIFKTKIYTQYSEVSKIKNNIFNFFINENFIKVDLYNSKNKNFSLQQLSSGEYLYLKHNINYTYSILNSKFNNIIIFLDEIELSLHPSWQKRIIYNLLINTFNKNIHFILTTHSPFLLSDIPKQNIIFLDTDEEGKCKVVDGLNDKKETFGANIHTLLSDSFFMEDGLIGEFAKGKIDKAISILNQKHLSQKDIKYCEEIISIVGEPIIKRQLQKMLDSKRLKDIDIINQKIEDMSYELEILKEHQKRIIQEELKDRAKKQYRQRLKNDKNRT